MADDNKADKQGMDMGFVLRTAKPYFERASKKLAEIVAGTKYADEIRGMLDEDSKKILAGVMPAIAGAMNIPRSRLPAGKYWNDIHWLSNEMLDEFVDTLGNYVNKSPDAAKLEEDLKKIESKWSRKWKVVNCEVKAKDGKMHAMMCPNAFTIKHTMNRIDGMKMGLGLADCCAGWFRYEDREAELAMTDGYYRALKELKNSEDEEFFTWHASLLPEQRQEIAWLLRKINDVNQLRMILYVIRRQKADRNRVLTLPENVNNPDFDAYAMATEMKNGPHWEEMKDYLPQVIHHDLAEPAEPAEPDKKPLDYVRGAWEGAKKAVGDKDGGVSRGSRKLTKRVNPLRKWLETKQAEMEARAKK